MVNADDLSPSAGVLGGNMPATGARAPRWLAQASSGDVGAAVPSGALTKVAGAQPATAARTSVRRRRMRHSVGAPLRGGLNPEESGEE